MCEKCAQITRVLFQRNKCRSGVANFVPSKRMFCPHNKIILEPRCVQWNTTALLSTWRPVDRRRGSNTRNSPKGDGQRRRSRCGHYCSTCRERGDLGSRIWGQKMGSKGSRLAESERGVPGSGWKFTVSAHPISKESTSSFFSGGGNPFLLPPNFCPKF